MRLYREMSVPRIPRTEQKILRLEIMLSFLFLIFLEICCVTSFKDHLCYRYVLFYHICWVFGLCNKVTLVFFTRFCNISYVCQVCFWWLLHYIGKSPSIFSYLLCTFHTIFCCCSHGFLSPTNQQGAILQLSTMIRWYQMRVDLLISQWASECLQAFFTAAFFTDDFLLLNGYLCTLEHIELQSQEFSYVVMVKMHLLPVFYDIIYT